MTPPKLIAPTAISDIGSILLRGPVTFWLNVPRPLLNITMKLIIYATIVRINAQIAVMNIQQILRPARIVWRALTLAQTCARIAQQGALHARKIQPIILK